MFPIPYSESLHSLPVLEEVNDLSSKMIYAEVSSLTLSTLLALILLIHFF